MLRRLARKSTSEASPRNGTAPGGGRIFLRQECVQPIKIGHGTRRDNQLHILRGLGAGSSVAVPQLRIQAFTSSQGTAARVR